VGNAESVCMINCRSSDSLILKIYVDAIDGEINSCVYVSNGKSVKVLAIVCLGVKLLSKNCK